MSFEGFTTRGAARILFYRRAMPAAAAILAGSSAEAMAHAADRGFVMLLPTGHYLAGGGIAVAASFLVLAFAPPGPLDRVAGRQWTSPWFAWPRKLSAGVGALAFVAFLALIHAGFAGSPDPLSNPLPLTVWTLMWIGLVLAQGVLGNLWALANPWHGPARLVEALGLSPLGRLPERVGYWPAVIQFFGFAWFELVYDAPDDPERLAATALTYFLVNLAAVLVFGQRDWLARGECLSAFFAMVSRVAPIGWETANGQARAILRLPGAGLAAEPPLPPSGAAFLVLALASVSFDGLMRTFFWFGLHGLNPLEFEGRSTVTGINGSGLAVFALLLMSAFLIAVTLGRWAADGRGRIAEHAGRLVWSLIPISLAYHFAHYLTALLLDGQYALAALSDPYAKGWNLFGTAGMHVSAGITAGADAAWMIWNLQAAAIVGGHLLAIVAAHVIAYRLWSDARRAAISQAPLALLMVGYTVFGLWLLATPSAG